ncbi:MAG: 3-oxoacyl-[acyl-carrier-protein] reductase [bacterium]|jgi:3-oxoacyl-[acyl-carrier protein] reductase
MFLENRAAIVTGGGRGIGKAIALALAEAGADVVLAGRNPAPLATVAAAIKDMGRRAFPVRTDVSNSAEAGRLLDAAVSEFGRVDVLVNNAGITRDALLLRMKEDDWDTVMGINLKGTFNCIKAAAKPMFKQRSGAIINITSVVGLTGNIGQANYSASKAGVIGLTKSAAKEFGPRGITVNAVAPGFIFTEMTEHLPAEAKESFLGRIPLGRGGTPEDVARVVVFLASPAAAYISGQTINVDGGMVM